MSEAARRQREGENEDERERWEQERNILIESMQVKQLRIAAAALTDRQRLLRKNQDARAAAYRAQWWSENDVQRLASARALNTRRAKWLKVKDDDIAAHHISDVRAKLRN